MKTRLPFKAILFDLDGTLIDSAADVLAALNHAFSFYHVLLKLSQLQELIPQGIEVIVDKAFALSQVSVTEEQKKQTILNYLAYYREHPTTYTQIYPGVTACLKALVTSGIQLAICSNKPSIMANLVLKKLKLDIYFSCVCGGDDTLRKKPDAQPVERILDQLKIPATYSVMVGDSEADVQAAHGAGLPAVVFCGDKNSAATIRADGYFDHFDHLMSVLTELRVKK